MGCAGCIYAITCPQTYACNTGGESVVDQHQNREKPLDVKRIVDVKRTLHERVVAKAESERGVRRTRLVSLARQPIAAQIEELGPLDAWCQQYRDFAVPNEKVDQILALEGLQRWLRKQRIQSERSLKKTVRFADFPLSKRRQYDEGLERLGEPSELNRCFVRMSYRCGVGRRRLGQDSRVRVY